MAKKNTTKRKVLFSFVGNQDPYSDRIKAVRGPILTLLSQRIFDRAVLFYTGYEKEDDAETTKRLIGEDPAIEVETHPIVITDPINHIQIIRSLMAALTDFKRDAGGNEYYVFLSPGTPQMHASWFLLAASGEFPAHLLQVRKPGSAGDPIVDVDLTSPNLPRIHFKPAGWEMPDVAVPDRLAVVDDLKIIGKHQTLIDALDIGETLAKSALNILILGESGTGKELFAKYIHELSPRRSGPFRTVNCAGLDEQLAGSLLFGHDRGAFTSAIRNHTGIFVLADTGTLFLDEVAELPLVTQAKLLRALQDGVITPIGASNDVKVNVRVISATNQDIGAAMQEKRFREDLYYRLAQGHISLPPLRERSADILLIAQHVIKQSCLNVTLSTNAIGAIQTYPWPGNIRELKATISRSCALHVAGTTGGTLNTINFDSVIRPEDQIRQLISLLLKTGLKKKGIMTLLEEQAISMSGTADAAAKLLGVSASALSQSTARKKK